MRANTLLVSSGPGILTSPTVPAGGCALSVGRATLTDMAYDEDLANRIREAVQDEPGIREKRMFGGLGFLAGGNLAVSASGQGGLMVRVDPADTEALVDGQVVHRMVMRGREMDGWLRVDLHAVERDDQLRGWVGRGLAYARSLPPK